ncbi:MAG: hypothetical protein ACI9N1_000171 [Flavobacteriales bacterium]|jgi:hypothetical protein
MVFLFSCSENDLKTNATISNVDESLAMIQSDSINTKILKIVFENLRIELGIDDASKSNKDIYRVWLINPKNDQSKVFEYYPNDIGSSTKLINIGAFIDSTSQFRRKIDKTVTCSASSMILDKILEGLEINELESYVQTGDINFNFPSYLIESLVDGNYNSSVFHIPENYYDENINCKRAYLIGLSIFGVTSECSNSYFEE